MNIVHRPQTSFRTLWGIAADRALFFGAVVLCLLLAFRVAAALALAGPLKPFGL